MTMHRGRTLRVAAAALLLGLAAGCDAGGPDADTAADTAPNPFGIPHDTDDIPDSIEVPGPVSADAGCAIVDEAALEQAVGYDVVMNDNRTGNCIATPESGAASAATVDFRIEPRTSAFDYFSGQPDATPLANLGDRAVWATLSETTGYVVTVIGSRAIVVGVARADGVNAQARRQAEAVARLLLQSLSE
jgi:hypothetical protein